MRPLKFPLDMVIHSKKIADTPVLAGCMHMVWFDLLQLYPQRPLRFFFFNILSLSRTRHRSSSLSDCSGSSNSTCVSNRSSSSCSSSSSTSPVLFDISRRIITEPIKKDKKIHATNICLDVYNGK